MPSKDGKSSILALKYFKYGQTATANAPSNSPELANFTSLLYRTIPHKRKENPNVKSIKAEINNNLDDKFISLLSIFLLIE